MIQVNKVGDSLTGAINGKQFGVAFSKTKYDLLLDLQKKAELARTVDELKELHNQAEQLVKPDFQELIDHYTPYIKWNRERGTYHLSNEGKVSPIALPKAFVQRIEESVSRDIDITPLVKGFTRFLRNKRLTPGKASRFSNYINMTYTNKEMIDELMDKEGLSAEVAKSRATTYQTPLTQQGLLSTYKVSTEITKKWVKKDNEAVQVDRYDFEVDEITGLKTYKKADYVEDMVFEPAVMGTRGDKFACESILTGARTDGHIIRVGHVHYLLNESHLNSNDFESGVPGLHVGGLDYIRNFQTDGTVTHNVFIDPMDIGAIPDDKTGAIRVLRYMVHSSFAGVNRSIYHASKYAEMTDAIFKAMVEDAIEKSRAKFEEDSKAWLALVP